MLKNSHRQSYPPAITSSLDVRYIYAGITFVLLSLLFFGQLSNTIANQAALCLSRIITIGSPGNPVDLSFRRAQNPARTLTRYIQSATSSETSGMLPPLIMNLKHTPDINQSPAFSAVVDDTATYTQDDSLDSPPEFVWMKYPDIISPADTKTADWQVTLNVLVDPQGRPLKAEILTEMPSNSDVGKITSEAVMNALFTPAIRHGNPVRCWIKIPLKSI